MKLILIALIGYIVGSIPFSYLVPLVLGVDIRKVGSGNVGGTNVLRNLGGFPGLAAMVLDGFKPFIPILIGRLAFGLSMNEAFILGFMATMGHNYSIFLKFKGGKGVACTLGTISGVKGPLVPVFFIVWLPLVIITKYVSLSSIIVVYVLALTGYLTDGVVVGNWLLAFALLTTFQHRKNIKALLSGTERKTDIIAAFTKKKKEG